MEVEKIPQNCEDYLASLVIASSVFQTQQIKWQKQESAMYKLREKKCCQINV